MRPVRAVLFDFGNTLFAHDPLAATISRLARSLGAPLDGSTAALIAAGIDRAAHTEDERRLGRDLDASVWTARWSVLYAIADAWVPGLGSAVMSDMHDAASWAPYARTAETLRALTDTGTRVGVVSNTGWDVRRVFAAHALDTFVTSFVLSCDVGLVKPDPAIFRVACARLDVDPAETLMVGDDVLADGGATAAGLRVVLLPAAPPGADNGVEIALAVAGAIRPAG
jgi:HAD superfamily hydrolase (TIGR01493 family)